MVNKTKAFIYVLKCSDGTLYTGYTTDVKKRLATHNAGKGAKYTKQRLPVELIYQEEFATKSEAMSTESYFKQKTRQEKLAYIAEHTKLNED
ncbi:GIY-YIG nuclease family protein [Streptococcus zalophi]|uniref:GIY-YIG nuclease family protein n=1 Tax=Streptococcus zalophi TaxID=640031 RepID=A0A934PB67_9STRE|nr:GIY-YIG nuclease family protein [Streptococcus zalophi]MBJ8350410.1 GIY-YIG nuclease family protein [Streptococcus zalophi]